MRRNLAVLFLVLFFSAVVFLRSRRMARSPESCSTPTPNQCLARRLLL